VFLLPFNKDDSPVSTGWVLLSLILANTAILIWAEVHSSIASIATTYGFVPAAPRFSTAVGAMFLHAGWLHLIGNMWFLWMFGRRVEARLGGLRFLIVYLICGLGGQALHLAFNHSSTVPAVGASGAISGVAGLYYVFFPRSKFDLDLYLGWWNVKTWETRTRGAVGAWVAEQAILGVLTSSFHGSGIAFWAHEGGFTTGVILAAIAARLLRLDWEYAASGHAD